MINYTLDYFTNMTKYIQEFQINKKDVEYMYHSQESSCIQCSIH